MTTSVIVLPITGIIGIDITFLVRPPNPLQTCLHNTYNLPFTQVILKWSLTVMGNKLGLSCAKLSTVFAAYLKVVVSSSKL